MFFIHIFLNIDLILTIFLMTRTG